MKTFICLIFVVCHGRCDYSTTFEKEINNFALGNGKVYVATDGQLYQLSRRLVAESQRVKSSHAQLDGVEILVIFEKNKTLITCGTLNCGYCEILDLNNISKSLYYEEITVASTHPEGSSLGFLIKTENTVYLLAGAADRPIKENNCTVNEDLITLRNTEDQKTGGIFSSIDDNVTPSIKRRSGEVVQFVDGFQRNSRIFIFSNVKFGLKKSVRLIWMQTGQKKQDILMSSRCVTLECCKDQQRAQLLSSADTDVGWVGVFTAGKAGDPGNTALAIFNITTSVTRLGDLCYSNLEATHTVEGEVVFTYPSMTSVAALSFQSWAVLLIGTADGQLLKISLDKARKRTCPIVLYKSDEDRPVFSKMLLDPVDQKHIYVAMGNQIRAFSVAQCSRYDTFRDCWSAQDPHCGWCVSERRCVFHDKCPGIFLISGSEISVPGQMVYFQTERSPSQQVRVNVTTNLAVRPGGGPVFSCHFSAGGSELCDHPGDAPIFPQCFCSFPGDRIPENGLEVTVRIGVAEENIVEHWVLKNCSDMPETSPTDLCSECISAGCSWSLPSQTCTWASGPSQLAEDVCNDYFAALNSSFQEPEIYSISPNITSFHGKNNASISGNNLDTVTKIRIQGNMDCNQRETPVLNRTRGNLRFHLPAGSKGVVTVCAVGPGGKCYGSAIVFYRSVPSCTDLSPDNTWASGGREIAVVGSNLEFVDWIQHDDSAQQLMPSPNFRYHTPSHDGEMETAREVFVLLRVANVTIACKKPITYHPDPEFTGFKITPFGSHLRVTIGKKGDKLNISTGELSVLGMEGDLGHECQITETKAGLGVDDSVVCEIKQEVKTNIESIQITLGSFSVELKDTKTTGKYWLLFIIAVLFPIVTVYFCHVQRRKRSKLMEHDLEIMDIRNEIRQGFVDLQTETSALIENVGTIPFLDYKHFATRIFFPETGSSVSPFLKEITQDSKTQGNKHCLALSHLIRNKIFLTSFVHALEDQKDFTIREKCTVASLLTLALHGDLPYLTEVMEDLLRDLMDQSSNTQPKLMLRRTESIVEKLLSNWISVCLYGFLRESVGQPLFLLVSALNQQISKGPVDSVTDKALYTLNEDWLLWQAQDFTNLKLNVSFPAISEGGESEPVEVCVLDCDTVEQVKEKILAVFKGKFGLSYNRQLSEINIEYERDGSSVLLQEVDGSSRVVGDVKLLNTLKHYQIPDGASVRVTSKVAHVTLSHQLSLKDDQDYSRKYVHLIDPDIVVDHKDKPERKKLKLKEVYLTKLLSTKVAVHSFVENLFRTIWGTANNRVPPAIKYFFDFLDAQAESKKITDPDVLHIWKTNSLPLRFWVNILKNPQFVFDIEKSPHLDSCLSVIAQAFMDSFSLTDQQLGKHAPTNKLLYAKDVPTYKQEVKDYYKKVREMPRLTGLEFRAFLQEEAKKHENELDETAALPEIDTLLQRYHSMIEEKLVKNGASQELKAQFQQARSGQGPVP